MLDVELPEGQVGVQSPRRWSYLYVPEPELRAVVRTAGDEVSVVRTPGQVGHSVSVSLQRPPQLQLVSVLATEQVK